MTGLSSSVLGVLEFIKKLADRSDRHGVSAKYQRYTGSTGKEDCLWLPESKTGESGNRELRFINQMFGGFIIGKLVDSLIIGIICFIGVTILNMPFPMLLSVIIGVTNVIPFFGPFIGAIPAAFLV